jgi:hypothetical protein
MHYYDLAIAFVAGSVGLPVTSAAVPNVATLGSTSILSDNDLAGMIATPFPGSRH